MKIKFALFFLGLVTSASAVDAPQAASPQPQPLALSAGQKGNTAMKPVGMRRAPSPIISETSVIRQADGSLAMNCVQKPNPKLKEQMAAQQAALHGVEPWQP